MSSNETYNGQNYGDNFITTRTKLIPWIKINLSGNLALSLCYEFAGVQCNKIFENIVASKIFPMYLTIIHLNAHTISRHHRPFISLAFYPYRAPNTTDKVPRYVTALLQESRTRNVAFPVGQIEAANIAIKIPITSDIVVTKQWPKKTK